MRMLTAARMHKHGGVICIIICGLLSPVKAFMLSICCRLLLLQLHYTVGFMA